MAVRNDKLGGTDLTEEPITDTDYNDTNDAMANAVGFALSTSLSYALDGVTTTSQDNLAVDLFNSDTAIYKRFMEYNSGTDLYECVDFSNGFYVLITASAASASSSGNNKVSRISSTQWLVYNASEADYETGRAKVYEFLFEPSDPSDGSTARIISGFTSVTAIATPDADDVGKRFHWAELDVPDDNQALHTYDGTFTDTSTNTDCSSWSYVHAVDPGGAYSATSRFELPESTTLNSVSDGTTDQIGTDQSSDETDNPADCQLTVNFTGSLGHGTPGAQAGAVRALILCAGDITWTDNTGADGSVHNYDFFSDGSIPVLTLASESDLTCSITTASTTIPSSSVNAIAKSVHTLTGSNTLTTEVTFDGGSNWQTINQQEYARVTNTGTSMQFRFTITRANDTETDSITSYAAYYR